MFSQKRNATVIAAALLCSVAAQAESWNSGNVQWLFGGEDYKLTNDDKMNILTLEYAGEWAYGDNFAFVDVLAPDKPGTEVYGEWHPRFSLGRIFTGENFKKGCIADLLLSTEYNYGNSGSVETRILLYGLGIDFDLPCTDWLQLNILVRDEIASDAATSCQLSPAWFSSFDIGSAHFVFTGFIDYVFATADAKQNLLMEPQLLLDVGRFAGVEDRIYLGTEYHYWYNKYGVDGVIDNTFQGMVKWIF